jgi:hypothetical protein
MSLFRVQHCEVGVQGWAAGLNHMATRLIAARQIVLQTGTYDILAWDNALQEGCAL